MFVVTSWFWRIVTAAMRPIDGRRIGDDAAGVGGVERNLTHGDVVGRRRPARASIVCTATTTGDLLGAGRTGLLRAWVIAKNAAPPAARASTTPAMIRTRALRRSSLYSISIDCLSDTPGATSAAAPASGGWGCGPDAPPTVGFAAAGLSCPSRHRRFGTFGSSTLARPPEAIKSNTCANGTIRPCRTSDSSPRSNRQGTSRRPSTSSSTGSRAASATRRCWA